MAAQNPYSNAAAAQNSYSAAMTAARNNTAMAAQNQQSPAAATLNPYKTAMAAQNQNNTEPAAPNQHNAYTNIAINTATQEKLTLMLYDGALKFANQAIASLENNDLIKFNEAIKRTTDIVWELQRTLDIQYEIAKNMDSLYEYIRERLVTANLNRDKVMLEEARNLLREFRDTWRDAMALIKK